MLNQNELIKVQTQENGKQLVSAKELYLFLGMDKSNWSKWAKKNIAENDFAVENEDWVGFVLNTNGNETTDYGLSIDFAKRLCMMARTEKGEQARNYFIACEKELKKSLPQTYKEALLELIRKEEEKEALLLENSNLNTVLDNLTDWVSIIKVCQHNKIKEKSINWRSVKAKSEELGYVVKKAESPRYGFQNLYHIDCFRACYPSLNYNFKKDNQFL